MKFGAILSKIAFTIRHTSIGPLLANTWHRLAPRYTIVKRIYGLDVCLDLRDHAIWLATTTQGIEKGEGFDRMLRGVKGNVWDVGSNVGVFALYASSLGNNVTAFEISHEAIRLIKRSAARNGLRITIVPRAFAVRTFQYVAPPDADTRNKPIEGGVGPLETSITFKEAEAQFGQPAFIKLDIEFAEVEFLRSAEFREWIRVNRIPILIEIHDPSYWDLVWPEVPSVRFSGSHVLLNPLPEMLEGHADTQSPPLA